MIDIQKWSKNVLRSEISLRYYNHACFVTTATTSLHIQPCLQHIQHPAQFFIVFLQLLACYSATQTPLQTISRFQTHAVGLFASPRFKNRCISVHLFSRQRPSWQWPALSRIACKSWTMLRKCVRKKSNSFLWNSLPMAVSTFHLYSVVAIFFQRLATHACSFSLLLKWLQLFRWDRLWHLENWQMIPRRNHGLVESLPTKCWHGISLGQMKMPLDVRQPQVDFHKIQILKSFLFFASDDSFWRISSNCLSSAPKNHRVKRSLSHPFWGGNRLGAVLSLGSLGRTEIEHGFRQQMERFDVCKKSRSWRLFHMNRIELYGLVTISACFGRLHPNLFTCQAITICPCPWIVWTWQSSLRNKLWTCLPTSIYVSLFILFMVCECIGSSCTRTN